MADKSAIEWTDATWNPITGCTKISRGCDNCYAERFAERFRGVRHHPFQQGFDLVVRPERLTQPLAWRKPRLIFVNSMSDLFHKEVPRNYIAQVFEVMERADWHIFQVLTKRSTLLMKFLNERYKARQPPDHIWFGVSVEDEKATSRIIHLRKAIAAVRFLSVEPLIGPIRELDLQLIDWVIVGGESGSCARPIDPRWVVDIRDRCIGKGVPFFFKQWGGRTPRSRGRLLEGREWNELPLARRATPVGKRAA
jgi:protein gp37